MAKKKRAPHHEEYRPGIELGMFGLALLGMLLTLHLVFWYGDSDTASQDPVCGAGFDCEAVLANDPAPLGIPSAVWGLIFYVLVALAGAAIAYRGALPQLMTLRRVLVGWGLLYSLFLTVVQLFFLSDRCILCLLSAVTVGAMAAVLVVAWRMPAEGEKKPQLLPYLGMAVIFAVLLGIDYVSSSRATPENEAPVVVEDGNANASICQYNPDTPYFENLETIITEADAELGNSDSPVIVLEFLDPNCNHCKTFHPTMKYLVEKYGNRVRFAYKPVTLVGGPSHSLDEAMALLLAAEEDVFAEMLELQFEHQAPSTGLTVDQLADFADDIGMNASQFREDIRARRMEPMVRQTTQVFNNMGLGGVPSIIIGGRQVSSYSRSASCLSYFIDHELEAQAAGS